LWGKVWDPRILYKNNLAQGAVAHACDPRRLRQEDQELEASIAYLASLRLSYIMRSCLDKLIN
jgi:hypothetical protein